MKTGGTEYSLLILVNEDYIFNIDQVSLWWGKLMVEVPFSKDVSETLTVMQVTYYASHLLNNRNLL